MPSPLKIALAQDLEQGFALLEQAVRPHARLFNRYLLLLSRYTEIKLQQLDGRLTIDDYRTERNQIVHAAIQLVDELEREADAAVLHHANPSAAIDPRHYLWKDQQPLFLETFDASRPNHSVFQDYDEAQWRARLTEGTFRLRNTDSAVAVKYHYFTVNEQEMSEFPVAVEVKVDPLHTHPQPAAGLIFCFDRDSRRYYAFCIGNDRSFFIWRKDEDAYTPLFSGRSNLIQPDAYNKIAVIKAGESIYLFINDEYMKTVRDGRVTAGDSGIVAMGMGTFCFDNLAVYPALRKL